MKITFIKDNKFFTFKKIRIFVKDTVGNDIQIDLRPGECVYSETSHITNSVRIYLKKGMIKVEEKAKPAGLSYYVGYLGINPKPYKFSQNPVPEIKSAEITEPNQEQSTEEETKLDLTKKAVEKYSKGKRGPGRPKKGEKVRKRKNSKGPGRPKKRGPKKGSKNKKTTDNPSVE
jgi:hypothetical protein